MNRMMHRGIGAALAAAVGAASLLAPGGALTAPAVRYGDDGVRSQTISMGAGKSVVIDLPQDAAEIVVGNPGVANVVVRTPRRFYVMGGSQGQTTIFALDGEGRRFATYEVSIGRDVGQLGPLLKAAVPNSEITPRTVNDTIILTGYVNSAADAQRAVDIAKGFAAKKAEQGEAAGGVVNALILRGEDQVMLKVTVAEVSRTVLKQLGVSTNTGGDTLLSGSWGALQSENPFTINSTLTASGLTLKGSGGTAMTIKAFERYNVARILAEPSVTAVSGESAKIVVGGEIAVPGPGGCMIATTSGQTVCAPSIAFKPYGVTLSFTPVVLSEGRIQIHLSTEVTEIDLSTTYSYDNVAVPGFKTRKNDTTLELPSGGSMAAAGLLMQRSGSGVNGLPGVMNLPVLGALFRSRDYQREETELLIVVTPYIVKPTTPQEVARPDDNLKDASDPQAWLLGRVNRIYASRDNPDLRKTFKGRVGFIHD
jgi:pilus assembly protein CpaC